VDEVIDRLALDPRMHVYHYGGYESGAIKRLMQRHAIREDEVDVILRAGVLVDLLNVVRQGIRASVESYSLKSVEHLFAFDRQGRLTRAGFSVVEYEEWLRDHDPRHLADLAAYNRDDCLATLGLRDWLEERRAEAIAEGWDLARPEARDGAPSPALAEAQAETQRREAALRHGIATDPAARDEDAAAAGCSPRSSTTTAADQAGVVALVRPQGARTSESWWTSRTRSASWPTTPRSGR
jgi:uncharacterized protein